MILITKFIARMLMTKQLFEFLKSGNVNEAVQKVERGMRGIEGRMMRIEDFTRETGYMNAGNGELAVQAIQLAIPSVIFLAFLPLSFFTSVCYLLSTT